jgi:uncharacterized protein DUF4190
MSQVPPAPPYGTPPGYGAPPPGYGGPPPGYPQAGGSKNNGWAITSLVCGIVGCLVITPIAAIIFGALGIGKANKDPQAGGKGMSIAGIVLGVVWLLIFTLFGSAIWALLSGTSPQREEARSFVKAISAGDVVSAQKYVTSDVTAAELATLTAQAKGWGTLKDTTAVGVSANMRGGETFTVVVIQAQYSNTVKTFQCEMVKENGVSKIRKYVVK